LDRGLGKCSVWLFFHKTLFVSIGYTLAVSSGEAPGFACLHCWSTTLQRKMWGTRR
jgi:hypothetical protein